MVPTRVSMDALSAAFWVANRMLQHGFLRAVFEIEDFLTRILDMTRELVVKFA
jgi:hypothetical protein